MGLMLRTEAGKGIVSANRATCSHFSNLCARANRTAILRLRDGTRRAGETKKEAL
jgi:hypothetical protein